MSSVRAARSDGGVETSEGGEPTVLGVIRREAMVRQSMHAGLEERVSSLSARLDGIVEGQAADAQERRAHRDESREELKQICELADRHKHRVDDRLDQLV